MPAHHDLVEPFLPLAFLPFQDTLDQPSRIDEKHPLIFDDDTSKYTQKLVPLGITKFIQQLHLLDGQPFLGKCQEHQSRLEFSLELEVIGAVVDDKIEELVDVGQIVELGAVDSFFQRLGPFYGCLFGKKNSCVELEERVDIIAFGYFQHNLIQDSVVLAVDVFGEAGLFFLQVVVQGISDSHISPDVDQLAADSLEMLD